MNWDKIVQYLANIAFWVFIAGMVLSIFKGISPLAALLLAISILLFVLFMIAYLIRKIFHPKK